MAKKMFNVKKLAPSIKHQAVCTNDSFAGTLQDTEAAAEGDAARHMAKPGNQNHVVNIVTVIQKVKAFKGK